MKKKAGILFIIMVVGFVLLTVVSFWSIYSRVVGVCSEATKDFGGDCESSLEKVLDSNNYSFEKRNKAIWALGQLADKRSLAVLNRMRGNREISRYELEKAIKWCSNGNWTSWMYKSL